MGDQGGGGGTSGVAPTGQGTKSGASAAAKAATSAAKKKNGPAVPGLTPAQQANDAANGVETKSNGVDSVSIHKAESTRPWQDGSGRKTLTQRTADGSTIITVWNKDGSLNREETNKVQNVERLAGIMQDATQKKTAAMDELQETLEKYGIRPGMSQSEVQAQIDKLPEDKKKEAIAEIQRASDKVVQADFNQTQAELNLFKATGMDVGKAQNTLNTLRDHYNKHHDFKGLGGLIGTLREEIQQLKKQVAKVNDQVQEINKDMNRIQREAVEEQKKQLAKQKSRAVLGAVIGLVSTVVSFVNPLIGSAIGAAGSLIMAL